MNERRTATESSGRIPGKLGMATCIRDCSLLFKSTIESIVESIKIFAGKDLNTDDVVILDGRPARVIRCGFWKCTFFCYDIGTANGKPYVKGGTKVQIQNDKLKDHVIERPLQMLDLSKWEESDKK